MNTQLLPRCFYVLTTSLLLLASTLSCKKDEPENPLLACRPSGSGGVGIANPRTIMFWIKQDLGCGILHLNSIRNTETNGTSYGGPVNANITQFFSTQPACGTTGTITIQVSQGYEYEYNISCTGRQWKDKVTVDCKSTDCIAIELR